MSRNDVSLRTSEAGQEVLSTNWNEVTIILSNLALIDVIYS